MNPEQLRNNDANEENEEESVPRICDRTIRVDTTGENHFDLSRSRENAIFNVGRSLDLTPDAQALRHLMLSKSADKDVIMQIAEIEGWNLSKAIQELRDYGLLDEEDPVQYKFKGE